MRERDHSTPHGETPYSPTSLLRALTANPYDVEALRREDPIAETPPPDSRLTKLLTLLLAVVLGAAVAIAAADLRDRASAEDSPRALLEQEVRDSWAEADELEARQVELGDEVAGAQQEVLDDTAPGAAEAVGRVEVASGGTALTGSGVVLQLDDSDPLPPSPGVAEGTVNRVTDGDLQIAVNGLWASGAEAISINGQRLTATSAIRTAGSAVLVDFRALSPPYRITALGDPEALREGVESGEAGTYLTEVTQRYALLMTWEAGEELTVPARPAGTLREATVYDPSSEEPA
ncbi:DUF881 domain-containing protein [Brachybacterium sp. J153]|uniref:DUF881 domain-containing protein n=1 Tax=Brachybacterium sp. J153 TaxID=3116488 RepID=UPI002E7663A4|nr:DUF881 domain-containing protein [Brachybacterium sp. J153]MEE1617472.1 DUF881 domain-containing protein [Brachybacterium sp. J153]